MVGPKQGAAGQGRTDLDLGKVVKYFTPLVRGRLLGGYPHRRARVLQ